MKKAIFLILAIIFLAIVALPVFAQNIGGMYVQTNSATNVYSNSATLNGNILNPIYNSTVYAWFQWGTTASYGNETSRQTVTSGNFSQNISYLASNTAYHFRAVAQSSSGYMVYGNDMTFYTTGSGYTGTLSANKLAINLSSGNLNWSAFQNASPSDIVSFAITLQTGNRDVHNVFVRDIFPNNLIYKGNLIILGSSNYSGADIVSGINFGTIFANQIVVISYKAQIAPAQNFSYGTSILNNSVTVTSNGTGTQTDLATIAVSRTAVSGASDIPTGTTNNFLRDSFLLPMLLIVLMSWLYFTGRIYKFADWLRAKI